MTEADPRRRARSLRPRSPQPTAPPQKRALAVIGTVVAPATLLVALMYVFGLLHAYWFFRRFGVDYTLMGMTTQDYLLRSVDGLFVPLVTASAVGLAVFWLGRCLPAALRSRARRIPRSLVGAVGFVVATALLAVAVAGILDPAWFDGSVAVPGLALTAAVVVFAALSRPRRSHHTPAPVLVAEWVAIFVLFSAGLYWAVTDYSASVGTERADELIAALPTWPDTVVYSEKSLNLALPGVQEHRCRDAEGAYAFRYDGLKLILQSGGQLFLLPGQWVPEGGAAVVLPRTDALRLEFTGPGEAAAGAC